MGGGVSFIEAAEPEDMIADIHSAEEHRAEIVQKSGSGLADFIGIYLKTLETGRMSDRDHADLHRDFGQDLLPVQGHNRTAISAAACQLAGREWNWDVPLEDIRDHATVLDSGGKRRHWAPFAGVESRSPEYGTGLWNGAFATFFGQTEWFDVVARPSLIMHALSAGTPPKLIKLVTHKGTSERRLDGEPYWGPKSLYSILIGERSLWADPLTASTLLQRSPAHPLISLACGKPVRIRESDWTHRNWGACLWPCLNRSAARPLAWGANLKCGRAAVEYLGELPPMPPGQRAWWQWHVDGSRSFALENGKGTSTRGVINVGRVAGPNDDEYPAGTVVYYTAAEDTGSGGSWRDSSCQQANDLWLMTNSAGGQVTAPRPEVELGIVYDTKGARIEIGDSGPVTPPVDPDPIPPPNGDVITTADAKTALNVLNKYADQKWPSAKDKGRRDAYRNTQQVQRHALELNKTGNTPADTVEAMEIGIPLYEALNP